MLKTFELADALVNGDREKSYDPPKVNFKRIARLWDAYLKNKADSNVTPLDVANMMILVKMARIQNTTTPIRDQGDSVVDMAGYVGCIERLEL